MFTREQAVKNALADRTNVPDTCQLVTRTWLGAASAGDFDGDGAADAEDGWKREPADKRHLDRNPPAGVPVSYLGGSNDNGHRALSLGNGKIRSTDAGGRGRVATVNLDWPEKQWGLKYAGWSETMNGEMIPTEEPPKPSPPKPTPVSENKVEQSRKSMQEDIKRLQASRARAIRKGYENRVAEISASIKHLRAAIQALPEKK